MGNYKFKLSDMIPNAWFYKLRDMSRAKKLKNSKKNSSIYQPRRSIYLSSETIQSQNFFTSPENPRLSDTQLPDFLRKSLKMHAKRKTIYKPSPRLSTSPVSTWGKREKNCHREYLFSSSENSDHDFYESLVSETEACSIEGQDLFNEFSSWSSSCCCRVTSSTSDIIIDVNDRSSFYKKIEKLNGFDSFSGIQLRPILTKPKKMRNKSPNSRKQSRKEPNTLPVKIVKECSTKRPRHKKTTLGFRKSFSNSPKLKLQQNSPRIIHMKNRNCARKSVSSPSKSGKWSQRKSFSKSLAIVKSTSDPHRDFKDSMVEMISVNGISGSKDLEELLACYLSLNSYEYHGVIVKAFEQIWFEMDNLSL